MQVYDGRVYASGGMEERDMDLDAIESCGAAGSWRCEQFTTPVPISFHASGVESVLAVAVVVAVEVVEVVVRWRCEQFRCSY